MSLATVGFAESYGPTIDPRNGTLEAAGEGTSSAAATIALPHTSCAGSIMGVPADMCASFFSFLSSSPPIAPRAPSGVAEHPLVVYLVLDVPQRRLREEHRVGVIPPNHPQGLRLESLRR